MSMDSVHMTSGKPQRSMPVIFFIVALLFSVPASSEIRRTVEPTQGPNDTASYRYIELENGLGALLVSDPRADKAAAALDVYVGSGDNPEDRPGLAHFTEHMLFLGTEKYPDPGEYHQFISSHGGSHNAYTAAQDTNYFFNVDPEYLEPALDRFSQQFVAPTFASELIEQERHAVHSEYTAMLREEGRRYWSAFQETFRPGHPLARFSVGNMDTLSNEDDSLRDETIAFYEDHYSANLMELVVIGPQSLNELQELVVPRFSPVKNREHEATRQDKPFFDADEQPRLLEVEALRDTRTLSLTFPIPSTRDQYREKPTSYLGHLIGHEGPGSLHDVLSEAGLASELSAGASLDTGDQAMMSVSIDLTAEGLERWRDVVALTFDYLDEIREDGIRESYFEEQQQLNELELAFREREQPMRYASSLAQRLHRVDPQDAVVAPWLYENFAPEAYEALLDELRPENVLVSVLAPFDDEDTDDWNQTEYYNTPYRITSLDPDELRDAPDIEELRARLKLPEPNPFIPEDLSMVDGETMDKPVQLMSEPAQLWYARDVSFDAPRGNVFLSLRSPVASSSPREKVLTRLMVETVKDELNAFAYPARIANLDYSVYDHLRGVTVQVSGYNDKLGDLYHEILIRLRHPVVSEERFELHLNRVQRELANASQRRPQQIATGKVPETLVDEIHSHSERLEASQDLTADDLRDHIRDFNQALDPVMLVHGNMTHAAALNLGERTKNLVMRGTEQTDVARSEVNRLTNDQQTLQAAVEHPDQGYVRYIQGDDTGYDSRARYRVMAQILSSPFYESIRTDQQLGYIVRAMDFPLLEVPALAFMVQSPEYDHASIDERVQAFLEEHESRLESMSEDEFEREKQAVISRLAEDDTRLKEVADRHWQEIDRKNYDFDKRERLIEAVESLSQEEVLETYRENVLSQPRQLLIDANEGVLREAEALQSIEFDGVVPRR